MTMLTIVLENNDGKGRTWGHIVNADGTLDEESYVTQINEGELDNALAFPDECPRCGAALDADDCGDCGMTSDEIGEDARPRCANFETCGHHIYMGDWDCYSDGDYYCADCVTVLDELPDAVPLRMFP